MSKYRTEPSSIRIAIRLFGFDATPPAAALGSAIGAGADVMPLSVAHPARMAITIGERIKGSLFMGNLL